MTHGPQWEIMPRGGKNGNRESSSQHFTEKIQAEITEIEAEKKKHSDAIAKLDVELHEARSALAWFSRHGWTPEQKAKRTPPTLVKDQQRGDRGIEEPGDSVASLIRDIVRSQSDQF